MARFAGGDVFRRAARDDVTAFIAGLGAEVDDPIGALDEVKVVLDDHYGMAGVNQTLKDLEQDANVVEVEAGGRFVEEKQRGLCRPRGNSTLLDFRPRIWQIGFWSEPTGAGRRLGQVTDELQALALAAAERVDRLAEPQITKTNFFKHCERLRKISPLTAAISTFPRPVARDANRQGRREIR